MESTGRLFISLLLFSAAAITTLVEKVTSGCKQVYTHTIVAMHKALLANR